MTFVAIVVRVQKKGFMLESIYCKSQIKLFVQGMEDITISKDSIILVKEATRKISHKLAIYAQITSANIVELGRITSPINSFQWKTPFTFLRQIPTDKIVRHVIKIQCHITVTQFIKMGFKCATCNLDKTSILKCDCTSEPKFEIQVRCMASDGTEVTSLELRNDSALKAFDVTEE